MILQIVGKTQRSLSAKDTKLIQLAVSYGMFFVVALKNAKLELLVPFERRVANLRRFDNDGWDPSPMSGVLLALSDAEGRD